MRFSSILQPAAPPPEPVRAEPPGDMPQPVPASAGNLPDDLDARVRLVGEWQLGEAW